MFTMFVPIDFLAVKLPDYLTDPSVKEYGVTLAILLALVFIVGLERFVQKWEQFPTIITTFLLASTAFLAFIDSAQTLIEKQELQPGNLGLIDPTRMISSIVAAVGVLCSFAIFKSDSSATGINTAMTFMGSAALVIQVGTQNIGKAFITVAAIVLINLFQKLISNYINKQAEQENDES